MSEGKPASVPQRILGFLKANVLSVLTIIAIGFLSHLYIESHVSEEWGKGTKLLAAVFVGFVFERILHSSHDQKTRVDKFMKQFHSSMGLAAPIIESLNNIQSQSYSKALEEQFVDQNLPRQVNALFDEWQKRIVLRHKWRLVFERHLKSEVDSISGNSLSLPLEIYLRILLDFIDVSMKEANGSGRKLVVRSFTNARPKDWFEKIGAPRAAAALQEYRTSLQQRVTQMHADRHTYRRYVLCSSQLSGCGFSDVRTVESGWLQLTEAERDRYFSVHTEGKDGALYVDLEDDITFCENHTEYIYFGFKKGTELSWEWCFCCLYTNNNLNVSASFVDMSSEADSRRLVIDTPDTKQRNLRNEFGATQLKVSFREFPDVIDRNSIGRVKPFRSVAPLAAKWHRASLIWHDDREAEVLTDYLKAHLPTGAAILDCACGTGFHSMLLAKSGFSVTASDIDEGNIAILKEQQGFKDAPFATHTVNWKNLQSSITAKFDCVLCLGSSITYYDSWREDAEVRNYAPADLTAILQQMKGMLKPAGKLIIGISRHYSQKLNSFDCTFAERSKFSDPLMDGVTHYMKWHLGYDWKKRQKTWRCEIENERKEDYSFELSSYLFDARDLLTVCQGVFGVSNASIEDVDSSYYDTLVVSKNP